jgi:hypothetical protein
MGDRPPFLNHHLRTVHPDESFHLAVNTLRLLKKLWHCIGEVKRAAVATIIGYMA